MEKQAIGYYGISNTGALGGILGIEFGINDRVKLLNGKTSLTRYDKNGEPYFISYGTKWYLSELVIINN